MSMSLAEIMGVGVQEGRDVLASSSACSWGVGERRTVRRMARVSWALAWGEEGSGRWTSAHSEEGTTSVAC